MQAMKKLQFPSNITLFLKMIEDRWVYSAERFTSIESSFHPCDLPRLSQGRTQEKPKCAKSGHFCARPSVTRWYCVETAEPKIAAFLPSKDLIAVSRLKYRTTFFPR